jgi:hypothetical protein
MSLHTARGACTDLCVSRYHVRVHVDKLRTAQGGCVCSCLGLWDVDTVVICPYTRPRVVGCAHLHVHVEWFAIP